MRIAKMRTELRQKVTVQTGGVVTIQSSELPIGETVEVIVLIEDQQPQEQERTLTSFIGAAKGCFATPEEADQFIHQERNSWDL
jgi:hypothetical protein